MPYINNGDGTYSETATKNGVNYIIGDPFTLAALSAQKDNLQIQKDNLDAQSKTIGDQITAIQAQIDACNAL